MLQASFLCLPWPRAGSALHLYVQGSPRILPFLPSFLHLQPLEIGLLPSVLRRPSTRSVPARHICIHVCVCVCVVCQIGKSSTGLPCIGWKTSRTPHPQARAAAQVASGRFGVTPQFLVNADQLEIKIAQGAKPGAALLCSTAVRQRRLLQSCAVCMHSVLLVVLKLPAKPVTAVAPESGLAGGEPGKLPVLDASGQWGHGVTCTSIFAHMCIFGGCTPVRAFFVEHAVLDAWKGGREHHHCLCCHSCRWWGPTAGQACNSVLKCVPSVTEQTRCCNARAGTAQAFARPE